MRWTAAVVGLVLAACGAPAGEPGGADPRPPAGEPYIEGTVTNVTAGAADAQGSILVDEPGDGNKASLTVAPEAAIWRETPDGLEPATFGDFAVGQTVAAWVSGPVMESFPVQAGADAVVIRP